MMTEQQTRERFAHYFLDLQADAKAAGVSVGKLHEWRACIVVWIEEGAIPEAAIHWKCPRSLRALVEAQA